MFLSADSGNRSRTRAELMRRAQKGDAEAFRLLIDDIGPVITNFLRRRIAERSELEDVCQDTLLAIYESRHTYEPWRPLEPWVFAIARKVGADHSRQHWARASWQELVDVPPEGAADGAESAMAKLRQSLERLPRTQRDALVMLKVEGVSTARAAHRTGTSAGTLKVRAHRAYQFLRESILG